MTRQEMFDKICDHLMTQMQKSEVVGGGNCLYRGPNGLQCAVGCIIKDEYYDDSIEFAKANDSCVVRVISESIGRNLDPGDISFLMGSQFIHDEYDPSEWKFKLRGLAFSYNLTKPQSLL